MSNPHPSERYSFIADKNPREIVLLRGIKFLFVELSRVYHTHQ